MTDSNFSCRKLPFDARIKIKDSLAQKAFKTYCQYNKIIYFKFGVDGTEKSFIQNDTLRIAPDKLCLLPSGNILLTELKGCKENTLRIKCKNMIIYNNWGMLFTLFMFIWNSSKRQYSFMPIAELYSISKQVGITLDEDMGEIHSIPCDLLDWSDLPIIHKPQYADNYSK